ncbi:MAG TPA: UDP-N-acetylmuramoyl-tripeptide--D-alanyl-D-alanine ligase [Firmicutes bacterium]|jgi:UDP-N-acetylmuramoyl-tripeptide--D-alanyl-D-alanine ligase|nr:UDP-N-acetylmuramoyl-tripeptide--D-alanyl-D-alanine ligase [Bacillota bacterium]
MIDFTLDELKAATGGILIQQSSVRSFAGVSTDSRHVNPGEIFIALKGEHFNGHDFLATAVQMGAAALIVMDDGPAFDGITIIKVLDTLKALGDIARFHRRRFQTPLIAITGSNGKTTTKDLVASILGQELPLVKTEANFNNEIGLPLTLLKIRSQTKAIVVEMGMRGLGQIRNLAGIAEPTIGLVTNVGLTHLELLKTQQNIAKAKSELIEALPNDGLAFLNGDDLLVREMQYRTKARKVFYGMEGPDLDYQAEVIEMTDSGSRFKAIFKNGSLVITLPIPGRHNIMNALAAIAVAKELGISEQNIQKGLAEPVLSGKRLNIIEKNGYRIIDDTYNASPTSVKAAIDVLDSSQSRERKIAVLADMLELGPTSAEIHYDIGAYAAEKGIDHLFACGVLGEQFSKGMNDRTKGRGEYFSDKQALIDRLKAYIKPGDFILVKGSRGMKMEEIVSALSTEEVQI